MIVLNVKDRKDIKIDSFPYKGKKYEVKETYIRWLSQVGPEGSPEYGLRYFTIKPKGEIPIHNHFYHQTMYVLEGEMIVSSYSFETDKKMEEKKLGANELVYIPSMEPHGCVNVSDTNNVTFLCCIANVYDEED